jgi:hypothetical protein
VVAAPVAVGCYAWHRRPGESFGPLLIVTGFAWFLTTLAESDDEVLYSSPGGGVAVRGSIPVDLAG